MATERQNEAVEAAWRAALERRSPERILAWAKETFGEGLTLACSFGGVTGMVLLDMLQRVAPSTSVFYLDTGFLFPETHATVEAARQRYGILPLAFRPARTPDEQARELGPRLWERDPDRCCALRKVEPNRAALEGKAAWIAGLRQDQASTRRDVAPVAWDATFGLYKIAPLWRWNEADCWAYVAEHEVPVNPLHAQGYASIGCTHCTRARRPGEDLRGGRWSESDKIECGLHR